MNMNTTPPSVTPPFRWIEVPTTGGVRKWQLRASDDSSDVTHPCRFVFWTAENGIHVVYYLDTMETHFRNVEEAMLRVKVHSDDFHAKRAEERRTAEEVRMVQYEAHLDAMLDDLLNDPRRVVRGLLRRLDALESEVQEVRDRLYTLEGQ